MKNTRPSGRQHHHPPQRAAEHRLPERRQADDPAARIGDDGHLEGQPRHHAGKRNAACHVVVHADHVGPQAQIVGDRAIGPYAAKRGIVPVEIRHERILSYARLTCGRQGRRGVAATPDEPNLVLIGPAGKTPRRI